LPGPARCRKAAGSEIWDVGSMLAAYHSALELELIGQPEFDERAERLLRTLEALPLYDGAAWNKLYSATEASRCRRTVVATTG
jgi:hypothetical protein